MIKKNTKVATSLASSIFIIGSLTALTTQSHSEVLEIDIFKEAPVAQNQLAYVPFAGDSNISQIINKDLQAMPIRVTSEGLIGQPHSGDDLRATLPAWQQLGIPYMVVGSSKIVGNNVTVNFEVIEVAQGRIIKGKQTVVATDVKTAARKASGRIYQLLTGKNLDLNAGLIYVEQKGSGESESSSLVRIDADGENKRVLAKLTGGKGRFYSPTVSPDGRSVVYSVQMQNNHAYLWKSDINGGRPIQLVDLKGSSLYPSFSPDGSKIIFSNTVSGDADIYRIDSNGGKPEVIIAAPYEQVTPSYGPNGSLVYASDHARPNNPRLYRYNFKGSPTQISRGGYATNPNFSPDGTQIAFLNGSNAAIMSTNGSIIADYGPTGGLDEAPKFSPTGERVVYSKGSKKSEIIIRYVNGGKTVSLPVDGIAKSPTWVPSGQ